MTKKITILVEAFVTIHNDHQFSKEELAKGLYTYKQDLINEINKIDCSQGIFMLDSLDVVSIKEKSLN